MMKHILAAVDGSPPSLKAVELAATLASKCDAELILFTVARDFSPIASADLKAFARLEHIAAPLAEAGVDQAQTVLADARLVAQAKGAARIATKSASGDPAEEIIAAARQQQADLIAIGSRGHGRLAGLLVGSVAQKVVAHATCPVLVVR